MSRGTFWATVIGAALAAGSTIAAAYIGASSNSESGKKADLIQNIQVGYSAMFSSAQTTVVQQQTTSNQNAAADIPQPQVQQNQASQLSNLAGEQCDDRRRRNDKGEIADLSGTKDIKFTIDASPCKRRIFLKLKGAAISTEDTGARTADFIVMSGNAELCKANASLSPSRGSNVEFDSGYFQKCEILLEAFTTINVHAFVSDINKADPSSIWLVLSADTI